MTKKSPVARPGLILIVAGSTRLELAASCVTGRRYNQLNYDPAYSAASENAAKKSFYILGGVGCQ